jgi:hypothetical protein
MMPVLPIGADHLAVCLSAITDRGGPARAHNVGPDIDPIVQALTDEIRSVIAA